MNTKYLKHQMKQFFIGSVFMLTAIVGITMSQGIEISKRLAQAEGEQQEAKKSMVVAIQEHKRSNSYKSLAVSAPSLVDAE